MPKTFINVTSGDDGTQQKVAPEHLGAAIKAGFKVDGADDAGFVPISKGDERQRVAPEHLGAALKAGFAIDPIAPAEPEEPADDADDAPAEEGPRETTLGEDLTAGAEGVGRGLTLGTTSPLAALEGVGSYLGSKIYEAKNPEARKVGYGEAFDQVARDIEARKAASPISAGIGEVAGMLAPALATGATALGAKGALAAGAAAAGGDVAAQGGLRAAAGALGARVLAKAPAGLVGRLGAAAATKTGAALAPRVGGLLSRGAGLLAQGAVEGTSYAAAQEIDHAVTTGDYDALAEKGLASLGTGLGVGALTSLGVGGALGAVGYAGRKVLGGAKKVGQLAGVIDTPLGQHVDDAAATPAARPVVDAATEADQDLLKQAGMRSEQEIVGTMHMAPTETERSDAIALLNKMGKQATAAKDFKKMQQSAVLTVSSKLNDVARTIQNQAAKYLNRSKKITAIKDALEKEGTAWTQGHANAMLAKVETVMGTAEELLKAPHLEGQALQKRALTNAIDAAKAVKAHLTGIKETGPISPESRILRGDLDSVAETFSSLDYFKTRLGQLQHLAGRNTESMTTAEAAIQRDYMSLRALLEDPNIWGNELSTMQRVTNAAESEAIRTGRVFEQRFAKPEGLRNERAGEMGFDLLADADKGKLGSFFHQLGNAENADAEGDFLVGMERMVDLMEAKSKFYRVPDELKESIAKARELVTDSASTMRTLKATKEMANEYGEQLDNIRSIPVVGNQLANIRLTSSRAIGAAGLAERAPGAAPHPLVASAMKTQEQVNRASKLRGLIEGTEKVLKKGPKAAEAIRRAVTYDNVDDALDTLKQQQDPRSEAGQELHEALLQIQQEAGPEMAQAMAAKLATKAQFILSKAGPRPTDSFGRPIPRDPMTVQRVARYLDAADDPIAALKRVADGEGEPEDIETLKATAPRMYQDFAMKAMDHLEGQDIPYDARIRASVATGLPLVPEMAPESLAWVAQLNGGQAPSGPETQPAVPKGKTRFQSPYKADQVWASRTDQIAGSSAKG